MSVKAFIFAGDYGQYQHFTRENHLNPREYPILTEENWRGIINANVIRIGTFWHNQKLLDMLPYIEQYLLERRTDEGEQTTQEVYIKPATLKKGRTKR